MFPNFDIDGGHALNKYFSKRVSVLPNHFSAFQNICSGAIAPLKKGQKLFWFSGEAIEVTDGETCFITKRKAPYIAVFNIQNYFGDVFFSMKINPGKRCSGSVIIKNKSEMFMLRTKCTQSLFCSDMVYCCGVCFFHDGTQIFFSISVRKWTEEDCRKLLKEYGRGGGAI